MRTKNDAEYEKMLEEATVDCYGDDEAFNGVLHTLEDKLIFPFSAEVLGQPVNVIGIDTNNSSPRTGILALVQAGKKTHSVALSTLLVREEGSKKAARNAKWLGMHDWWANGG